MCGGVFVCVRACVHQRVCGVYVCVCACVGVVVIVCVCVCVCVCCLCVMSLGERECVRVNECGCVYVCE